MPKHMEVCHPEWEQHLTPEYHAKIGVSRNEQDAFGLLTTVTTSEEVTDMRSKRPASSPPGTPHSKAREEQQQRKSRRVEEGRVVDLNEDVFAT